MAHLLFYTCRAESCVSFQNNAQYLLFFCQDNIRAYNNQVFFPDEGNNDTKKHIRAFSITTLIHVALSLQFSVSVPSKRTRSCAYECVPLPNNPRSPPFLAELQSLN